MNTRPFDITGPVGALAVITYVVVAYIEIFSDTWWVHLACLYVRTSGQ